MKREALAEIRELIFQKSYKEAEDQLKLLLSEDSLNSELIDLNARLHGQAGDYDKAVTMFEDLEAAWPEREMIFVLHAKFLQEAGLIEDSLSIGYAIIEKFPETPSGKIIVADCLELLGRIEEAFETVASGIKKWPANTGLLASFDRLQPLFKKKQKTLNDLSNAREEIEINHCQIIPDEKFLNRFMQLFAGRRGVYALQTRAGGGKYGYRPVYEDISREKIREHLAGDVTLGVYPVSHDNTSRMMILDIDVCKTFLEQFLADQKSRVEIKSRLRELTTELINAGENAGLRFICETSGYKGIHLWAFCDFDLPARYWRVIARWVTESVRHIPAQLQIEIFPKQDTVPANGIGNLVKLPLGIHKASGKRSFFIDSANYKPLHFQRDAIDNYEPITRSEMEEILGRVSLGLPASENISVKDAPFSDSKTDETLKNSTRARVNSYDDKPLALRVKIPLPERFTLEIEQILAGCQPLYETLNCAVNKKSIEPQMRHVLIYIFATLGEEGRVFLHQVLNQLPDYDPDRINAEIRAVPPTTMSCAKVRKNMAGLYPDVRCNCQFRLPQGCYASPVAHAGIFPGNGRRIMQPVTQPAALTVREQIAGASASVDRLMSEYRTLNEELERLLMRRRLLHNQISRLFDEEGADEIITRIARYTRLPELAENVACHSESAAGN